MTPPRKERCPGCGEKVSGYGDVALTMVDHGSGRDWHEEFCTPRCAYDWWREVLKEDYGTLVEPDLLIVVAHDIFDAVEGFRSQNDITAEEWAEIVECWERLGHVLGQLNLDPAG